MPAEPYDIVRRATTLHTSIVDDVPQLKRGRVWCHGCGATLKVDSAECLRHGWPRCCGCTMSIDSPEERDARP